MNNKEFQGELSKRLSITKLEVESLVQNLVQNVQESVRQGERVSFSGIGTLEMKKRSSRISVMPQSEGSIVVPEKNIVSLKVVPSFKEKIKTLSHE
ncbi:MAG: HU family DNA-binding protein [Paludibacteraceae bacterium]|nr:HU family DNA-binding protein [Paludibacteraceae bacterium]